jgi:hypothetical protein
MSSFRGKSFEEFYWPTIPRDAMAFSIKTLRMEQCVLDTNAGKQLSQAATDV